MPLARTATLLLGAAALSILPALAPDLPGSVFPTDIAYAKNGNSNGNGNGNSNGNSGGNAGGGNGKSGGNGNSASNGGGNKGLGLFNRVNGKKRASSSGGNGKGLGGFLNSVFDGNGNTKVRQSAGRGSRSNGKSHRLPKSERATLASVGVTPTASPLGKPKNFNAKLGRLNSLKRNYRGLLNSNSPHLAGIQDYINDYLTYENGLSGLTELQSNLDKSRDFFAGNLVGIEPYDTFTYDDATAEELEARLAALNEVDAGTLTDEEAEALEAERSALTEALADESFTDYKEAETSYKEAEEGLGSLAEKVSDESLEDALREMANKNRFREYGDEYVDAEMLDWAKRVLGTGDYDGKIDEIRDAGYTAAADEDGESPTD